MPKGLQNLIDRLSRVGAIALRGRMIRPVLAAAALGGVLAGGVLIASSCRSAGRTVAIGSAASGDRVDPPLSMSSASADVVRDEPLVRVRVRRSAASATLPGRGQWVVSAAGSRVGEAVAAPARVVASGGGIRVIDGRGRVSGFGPGVTVFAAPRTAVDGSGWSGLDRDEYPGTLRLVPRDDPKAFDVINVVSVERYLPGVISRELLSHWHPTAFRAQAVAARTFALSRREAARKSGKHFDVENTTRDQVYGGRTGLAVAHQAVHDTRGIVLVEGGGLGDAVYSSTCGGRPASPSEVWPDPVSASVVVPASIADGSDARRSGVRLRETLCDDAPLYRWSVVRRTEDLARRLRSWGAANGRADLASLRRLTGIRPIASGVSGRPVRFEITGSRGSTIEITAERLRLACNAPAEGLPAIDRRARVQSNDLSFDVSSRLVRIEGRGFGHGAGMCQYCAAAMADRGDHFRDALAAFYPGLALRRVY
ncbi:MAG: SpoIID/LytB domain-containing protein [Planctomycetota bacterium]